MRKPHYSAAIPARPLIFAALLNGARDAVINAAIAPVSLFLQLTARGAGASLRTSGVSITGKGTGAAAVGHPARRRCGARPGRARMRTRPPPPGGAGRAIRRPHDEAAVAGRLELAAS
jgi:hypothetical protein